MEVIRQNRLIAAILGGLVVVSALVLIFNDGSDSPSIPTSDLPTSTAAAPTPQAARFPGPNIEQLECGPLLDFDDVDAALGTSDWLTISGGETCTHRHIDDADRFVRIGPGAPTDLIDGGTLEGESGQPVDGIGDVAAWFPSAATLSTAAEGRFGVLIFRVTISNPDLSAAERLDAAEALALAALPRFSGIDAPAAAPAPEAPVVTVEHEPPDQAEQSYVANLLAREAAGDWTHAEGLIATLALFAGETTASRVTPARSIDDESALGILRLADEYLEANPAGDDADELARLRQLVAATPLPPPSDTTPADPSPTATANTSSSRDTGRGPAPEPIAWRSTRQSTDDCYVPYPDAAPACFLQGSVEFSKFGDKYTLWFPDIEVGESWEGWVRGDSPIEGAVTASAAALEELTSPMPRVAVWLTPHPVSSISFEPGACDILLGRAAQDLLARGVPLLEQAIASAMARCYIFENFGKQELAAVRAWESALAWYVSDVIFETASAEIEVLKVPETLGSEELGTTLLNRANTNMAFFEYLGFSYGLQRTVDLGGIIAAGGYAAVPDIDRDLHGFAQTLTDGKIFDEAGFHTYGPPASQFPIDGPITVATLPKPFGVERVRLSVSGGQYACIEYPHAGNLDLRVSWRPGSPGDGSDSSNWSTDLPASIQGTATFLITTVEPDGQFDLKVKDLGDNPDCEDDPPEGSGDTPPPPCGLCDPTSFWYDLRAWFTAIVQGS